MKNNTLKILSIGFAAVIFVMAAAITFAFIETPSVASAWEKDDFVPDSLPVTGNQFNVSDSVYRYDGFTITITGGVFTLNGTVPNNFTSYDILLRLPQVANATFGSTIVDGVKYVFFDTDGAFQLTYGSYTVFTPTYSMNGFSRWDFSIAFVGGTTFNNVKLYPAFYAGNVISNPPAYAPSLYSVYSNAQATGYDDGYEHGFAEGQSNYIRDTLPGQLEGSYNNGHSVGFSDGLNSASEYSFMSLMSSVVDAPLNVFTSMFNFEILGVDISGFLLSLFTLALVVTVTKFVLHNMV